MLLDAIRCLGCIHVHSMRFDLTWALLPHSSKGRDMDFANCIAPGDHKVDIVKFVMCEICILPNSSSFSVLVGLKMTPSQSG